eukprot:10382673-Alexandrium_andersonii.AAC.1
MRSHDQHGVQSAHIANRAPVYTLLSSMAIVAARAQVLRACDTRAPPGSGCPVGRGPPGT